MMQFVGRVWQRYKGQKSWERKIRFDDAQFVKLLGQNGSSMQGCWCLTLNG